MQKETKLKLKDLSVTGGIVNAANAVELAFTIDQNNKKKKK